jgi:oligosaccharide repeat unit polymerase
MLIYELFFVISVILLVSLSIFVKDVFNPVFVFVASLWFGILWAMLFAKKWDLNLSLLTFNVFVLGIGTFAVVGIVLKLLFERHPVESVQQFSISVKDWKIDLAIMFTFVTLIISAVTIKRLVPAASLADSIYLYRVKTTFWNMLVPFPSYLNYMRMLTYAIGFWFAYYLAAILAFKKRLDVRSLLVVVFSALSSLVTGSRNNLILFIMFFLFFLYFCSQAKNGWNKGIRLKPVILGILFAVILLVSFQNLADLLGRNTTSSPLDYLAEYVGAEVYNLNLFLGQHKVPLIDNYAGTQTFINFFKTFGRYWGASSNDYSLNLPFNASNGYNLGNVYTTFYPYLYDFGISGMIFLTVLMATISELIHIFAKKMFSGHAISVMVLVDGYIFTALAFSFFSNKFYEQLSALGFFEYIIVWLVFSFLLPTKKKSPMEDI